VLKPVARTDELVVEEAGDEVLVYDQQTAAAHCLTSQAAAVWRACDGQTTPAQIAVKLEFDPETVSRALEELERCELLQTFEVPKASGVTRREATLRFAKVGAAAAAAPLIYSIAAPTPAMAQSQAFCLALGCGAALGNGGCDTCFAHNCCCCCPGESSNKHCTADCTPTNCSGPQPCNNVGTCNGTCHGGMGEANPCST
jgi:hypothetical protein